LVLADNYGAHDPIAGYEEIPYYPPDETALRERDHIDHWTVAGSVQSGVFVYTDFDDTAPRKNLLTSRHHPHEHARWDLERYDYPGGYTDHDTGDQWVRARIEELHVDYETTRGAGNACGLATGALFTLTGYPRRDQNREYLILSTDYQLQSDAFGSSGVVGTLDAAATVPLFHCTFTALDAKTPYRPPRNTPKARVQGPQTAIVVGPAGQEIWTDQYGRVKIQFHWDRYGQSDDKSSCWVRVSQPWAGKGWGTVAIPRIGQEVTVDFLEGDPDRPIITGRVYNDVNKPPYGFPGSAVISGLRSNSTKGGGGYNEYVMDDTKGQELIREHAQYDKDSTIEHDLREQVLNDRSREVTNDETIRIGKDRAKTIGNDETIAIGGDRSEQIEGTASLKAQHLILEAGNSITLKVGGGWLVVDHTGVTFSNVPPNQPVVNRGSLPLTWLQDFGSRAAQALTSAAEAGTPFVAGQPLDPTHMSAGNLSPVMDKTKYLDQRKLLNDPVTKSAFPKLGDEYEILAPEDESYNCIGHTLDKNNEWLDPVTGPTGNPFYKMDKIYNENGYKRMPNMDASYEMGKKKVIVYGAKNPDGSIKKITHGAIQDNEGFWESKLGQGPLIRHPTPEALNGPLHGEPVGVYEK